MIDAMGYRLPDIEGDWQYSHSTADVAHDLGAGSAGWFQRHVDFGGLYGLRMLIELGAAGAPPGRRNFGNAGEQAFRQHA